MKISTKLLITIILVCGALLVSSAAVFADPYLRIRQTIPDVFVNDFTGREYEATIDNTGDVIAQTVAVSINIPDGGGFFYKTGTLTALFKNNISDSGTPLAVTVTGSDPINVAFNTPLSLAPGQIVEITYRLGTTTGIAPGNTYILQFHDTYTDGIRPYHEIDEELLDVKRGLATITLTPISPLPFQAKRGEVVTLEARVTNNGDGSLFNLNFNAVWAAGFGLPQLVPASSNITPTLVGNTYQTVISEIPVGESRYFQFQLTVIDYQNFDLTSTVTDPADSESPYSDLVIFVFIMNQPNITITAPDFTIDYGITKNVSITVVNNDAGNQGPAREFKLYTEFHTVFTVTNISAGWSYAAGVFTYTANGGVINQGQTVPLTFDVVPLNPNNFHEGVNGAIRVTPSYQNDIGQSFSYPLAFPVYSMINVPTLTLAQNIISESTDGDNLRIFLGERFRFEFTPTLTHVDKWKSGEEIVLVDNITSDFTIQSVTATLGIVEQVGNQIRWRLTPAQAATSPMLTINVQTTTDPNRAGNFLSNSATISGTTIWDVTRSDTRSTNFYLQSRNLPAVFNHETKAITNLPVEGSYDVCGKDSKNIIAYELYYVFDSTSGGTWTGSTLMEMMDQNQVYVAGTAQYKIGSGGTWTNVPGGSVTSTTPLTINLGFLTALMGSDYVRGQEVYFRYNLSLTNASLPSGGAIATTFIARTTLTLANASGGAGVNGNLFYEGVFVPISRAALNLWSSFSTEQVSKGQIVRVTLHVDKLTPWDNNNLTLTLTTNSSFHYLGNLTSTLLGGLTPTATISAANPDIITFTFSGPLEVNQGGTVSFDMVKTDSSNYTLLSQLDFDDDLGVRFTDNYSRTPAICLQGNLSIVVTPSTVKVANDTITWNITVTNIDSGTAYGVIIDDILKQILTYSSSTLDGVNATPTIVNPGDGTRRITWSLGDLAPGQSRTIAITAHTSGSSSDFTNANQVSGNLTWIDRSAVAHPFNYASTSGPLFIQLTSSSFMKNSADNPLELCADGVIKLYLKNNGLTTNYNYIVTQNFGSTGFEYRPGTTTIGGITVNDPVIAGTTLTWTFNSSQTNYLAQLLALTPGQELTIEIGVKTHETFNSYQRIQASSTWQKPTEKDGSNRTGATTGAEYRVPLIQPNITVVVDGRNLTTGAVSYIENVVAVASDQVEWRITITNSGMAAAKNVTLVNTLPANMTFVSISPAGPPWPIKVAGSSWTIADIPAGTTVTYYVIASFSGACGPTLIDRATVTWGPETSSLSTPGVNTDTANFITQAMLDSVNVGITGFTTKKGTVTVTLVTSGAPMYNLNLPLNISNRFELDSAITYSAGLTGPTLQPVLGTDGNVLAWQWAGPITAGTHTITFDIRDANNSCSDGSSVNLLITNYTFQNSRSDIFTNSYSGNATPAKTTLSITKTPVVQISKSGNVVSWTIQVTNTGNTAATDLEIVDILGDGTANNGFTFTNSTPAPTTISGNTLTWSGLTLAVGATYTITINTTANSAGLHMDNVTATEWNKDKTAKVDEKTTSAAVALVEITKTVNQTLAAPNDPVADSFGELATFTIRVDIGDQSTYRNMVVRDTLPNGLQFVDEVLATANGKTTVTSSHSGKNLVWNLTNFDGTETITITYRARIIREGSVVSGSVLTNATRTSFDIYYTNGVTVSFADTIPALQASASLTVKEPSVSLTSRSSTPATGSQVIANQEIDHTLTVANTDTANTSPGYEVRVEETIPIGVRNTDPQTISSGVGVTKGAATLVKDTDFSTSYNGSTGVLTIVFLNTGPGILQRNEVFTITYKTKVDAGIGAGATLAHTATLIEYFSQPSSTVGARRYTGNTRNASFNTVLSNYSLTVTSPASLRVKPGVIVTYQSTITIPKGTSVYDISLVQSLPAGLDFVVGSSVGLTDQSTGLIYLSRTPTVAGVPATGETLTWALSTNNIDIVNASADDLVLTITFNAVVLNTAQIVNGGTLPSTFIYNYNTLNDNNTSRTTTTGVSATVTVVEPVVTITKTILSSAPYEAGNILRYRLTVRNTSATETAYDAQITSLLSSKVTYSTSSTSSHTPAILFGQSGQLLTWGADGLLDIAPGETVTFDVEAILNSTVEPNEQLQNTGTVTWTSLDGMVANERTYTQSIANVNDITVGDPTAVAKTILGTPKYVIGESFDYRAVLTVLKGTTNNVILRDTLPAGVELVSYTITNGNGGITYTLGAVPSAGATGAINWTFGTVVNPDNGTAGDETITVQYTVRILNLVGNQAGNVKTNSARASYTRYVSGVPTANTTAISSRSFTVKEPQLVISKSYASGSYDAGDTVVVTVRVWHNPIASPNDVSAHDVSVSDPIPTGLTYVSGSANNSGALVGSAIAWTVTEVDLSYTAASPLVLTYNITIDDTVKPGQTLTSTATTTWTSLAGVVAGERTGAGGIDDYTTTVSASIQTTDRTALSKSLTSSAPYPVGATVAYRLIMTLNEGTTNNVVLRDTLPAGAALRFVSATITKGNVNISYPLTATPIAGATGTLVWDFGTILNPGNGNSSDDTITIDYTVVIQNVGGAVRGTNLANSARLEYIDGASVARTTTTVSRSVTVVEPLLNVALSEVTAGPYHVGDTVTYNVTVSHTGASNATAYDLQLTDILPAGLTYVSVTANPNNPGAPQQTGQQLVWGADGSIDLPVGSSYTFRINAVLADTVEPEQSLSNSIGVTYNSTDGANADERSYSANSGAVTITSANATSLTKSILGTPTYVIGENFTYQLAILVNRGTTRNVVVNDTLPAGVAFVSATLSNDAGITYTLGSSPTAGATGAIAWNLGTVVNSASGTTITIQYTVRILNVAGNQAGNTRTNSAYVAYVNAAGTARATGTQTTTFTIKEPLLTLSKSYSAGSFDAGDTVTVTVRVWHNSTSAPNDVSAYDAVITDTIPAGMTYVTGSANASGTLVGSTVVWNAAQIDLTHNSGNPVVYTYQVTLDNTVRPGQQITGGVNLQWTSLAGSNANERTGADGPSGSPNDYAANTSATTNAVDSTSLSHTLPGGVEYTIGATVPYRIRITVNEGTTTNVVARSVLPAGMRFVSAVITKGNVSTTYPMNSSPNAGDTGTISWDFGTVLNPGNGNAADDIITIDYLVLVTNIPGNIQGTVLTIPAHLEYVDGQSASRVLPNQNVAITLAEPNLQLTKTGPVNVQLRTAASFTITVNNTGNSTAWQTVLLDTLPGEMRAQTPTITSIIVGSPARTLLESGPDDYDALYNATTGQWTITFKSAAARIAPGETLTIIYQSILNDELFTVRTISNTVEISSYYSMDSSGGLGTETRTYPAAPVTASASFIIQTPVLVTLGEVNRTTASPGDVLHYKVTITNNGNTGVSNATFTGIVGVDFVPGTVSNVTTTSGSITVNPTGGTNSTGSITVTGVAIAPAGGQVVFEWDVTLKPVIASGTLADETASLAVTDLPGPVVVDIPETLIQSAPVFVITKRDTDVNSGQLAPGDVIRYTIIIRNTGNENARDAILRDLIPSNTTYIPNSTTLNGAAAADTGGTSPLVAGLAINTPGESSGWVYVGGTVTVEFSVTVNVGVAPGTNIVNQATLNSSGDGSGPRNPVLSDDPDTSTPGDATRSVVGNVPMLYAVKTVADDNGGILNPNEIITYTITVYNNGTANATNVVFGDRVPNLTTYTPGSFTIDGSPAGITIAGDGSFTYALGAMAPGSQRVIVFKVQVNAGTSGQVITNQGRISSAELPDQLTDADGNPANGSQPTDILVGNGPVLRLIKQAADINGGNLAAGETVEFTLTIRNIGTTNATNVVITDVIPGTLVYVSGTTTLEGLSRADLSGSTPLLTPGLNIGTLTPGETVTIKYRVTVGVAVPPGTVIDTQASFAADGGLSGISDSDLDDGIEQGNDPANPNDDDPTRLQTGGNPGTANLSGTVWWDQNVNNLTETGEPLAPSWTVEIMQQNTVIATTTTDSNGYYQFVGLIPGGNYRLRFTNPNGNVVWKVINNITLLSGTILQNQNLALHPTGVVYDSIMRQPVPGAVVSITGPAGFDPALHLLPGQQDQVTGADGRYRFDVLFANGAPAGLYQIAVTPPNTFSPGFPSTIIAPQPGTYAPANTGTIEPIVANPSTPANGQPTTYYLVFNLNASSAEFVSNHIPVDPILRGAIVLAKTAGHKTGTIGAIIPYTIRLENTTAALIQPFTLNDVIPAGFKYVRGSARINGVAVEPVIARDLNWTNLSLAPHGTMTITYNLVIGSGVVEGKIYKNEATAIHGITGLAISNYGEAYVQVVQDPVFTQAIIIGKVFCDCNGNGIQDEGEEGIAGVRLVTVSGKIITTDEFGRYHVDEVDVINFSKGQNFIIKLDPKSLPPGAEITTENPRVVRITQGMMTKINFGVKLP
jgi:uncharacterized repeat protein (TIGR01451 family)/fimbrial isopeptide formation D2 family protein